MGCLETITIPGHVNSDSKAFPVLLHSTLNELDMCLPSSGLAIITPTVFYNLSMQTPNLNSR
jgi:hypothetical protein